MKQIIDDHEIGVPEHLMPAETVKLPTQACGNALQICDSTTGHSVQNVAFCRSPEMAKSIIAACNAHDDLIDSLKSARSTLVSAIKANWEGATDDDVSGHLTIKQIDTALAKAGVSA